MPRNSFWKRPAVLLGLALVVLAILLTVIGKFTGGSVAGRARPLATAAGAESYPAIAPDGKRLAFSVRLSKNEPFHLFTRNLPGAERTPLTKGSGSDLAPAWSPDGKSLAFLRVEEDSTSCMVIPAAGGAERKIADCSALPDRENPIPAISWTPGGDSLMIATADENQPSAIAIVPVSGGAAKRITNPPEGALGDGAPAVSPDGKTIAFVRLNSAEGGDLYVCDANGGNVNRLTFDDRPIRGIAWRADGSGLIYAGYRLGFWRLWRLPATGGSPLEITDAGNGSQFPALSSASQRLVYTRNASSTALWRAAIGSKEEGRPLIRSAGREFAAQYSPDGALIVNVSDQSGADEIWLSDAEGGHRTQMTQFKGSTSPYNPRFSPDSRRVVFSTNGTGTREVYVAPIAGGSPKRILVDGEDASFSRDGKSILYISRGRVWKSADDGSGSHMLSQGRIGAAQPEESSDGKYVYYRKWRSIWRMPAAGGQEEEIIQPERGVIFGGPAVTAKGVYYVEIGGGRREVQLAFYDFATQKSAPVLAMEGIGRTSGCVSRDRKCLLYSRSDRTDTTLMLVEGFK